MDASGILAPWLSARVAHPTGPLAQLQIVSPVAILILCVLAGIATVLMLPGRKEASWAKLGGILGLAAGLIFVAVLLRWAGGAPGTGEKAGMGIYFWLFSAVAVVSALRVVTHPRPVYAALYFVLTILASAGLFILVGAEFVAAALVVIYAGAILVTYVFVIMLAQQAQSPGQPLAAVAECDTVSREPVVASAVGFALMGLLLLLIFDRAEGMTVPVTAAVGPAVGSTQALGRYLFENQVINLELAGLLLTVAMVGAIAIARRRPGTAEAFEPPVGEIISTPATPQRDDPQSIPVHGTRNPRAKAYPEN